MRAIDLPPESIDAYLAGESVLALASRYGVSRQVVNRHLRLAGVKQRNSQEAALLRASRMTPIERKRQAVAAHAAKRGKRESEEQRERVALSREANGAGISDTERTIMEWLAEAGITALPQKAVGRYNIDLAIDGLAVEVLGGGWHSSKKAHANRTAYLLDRGWRVLFLWTERRHSATPAVVDAIRIAMRSSAPVMQACGHGYIGIHDDLSPSWPGKCD
jgi:very-short-patch-repair endonuclease